MENDIALEYEKEKKRKQEYLKKQILEEEFDPENFSNFLISARNDGDQVDNWTMEELETMVVLFKREIRQKQPILDLQFKLEDIELNDEQASVYAKVIKTPLRSPTTFSTDRHTVQISKIDVIDGGLFYGKSLAFQLYPYPLKQTVIRTDDNFRWLHEAIGSEFPQTPIPPLVKCFAKNYDDETLKMYKYYHERFLNELLIHPELRYSLYLETFLKSRSKEEFEIKIKEISKMLSRNILLERNLTKKKFDTLNHGAIFIYPTPNGKMSLKISHLLKNHFVNSDLKLGMFDMYFEKLERITLEYDKIFKKLIKVNERYRETIDEMTDISNKYNSSKSVKYPACLSESLVFSTISGFLQQQGDFIRKTLV